jgi:hypothetical protein
MNSSIHILYEYVLVYLSRRMILIGLHIMFINFSILNRVMLTSVPETLVKEAKEENFTLKITFFIL